MKRSCNFITSSLKVAKPIIMSVGFGVMSVVSLSAQSADGSAVDVEASRFDDVLIAPSTDVIGRSLHMETLWEWDMSKVSAGDASQDAFQNDHNLFVIDNIVYAYVEKYQVPGQTITLRRFDIKTGENLADLYSDFPSDYIESNRNRTVMTDNAGHIAVVSLFDNKSRTGFELLITVYDKDFQFLKSISYNSTSEHLKKHGFMYHAELLDLSGDLTTGDFRLTVGCWHCWGGQNDLYYPSRCEIVFANDVAEPQVFVTRYDNGDYVFDERLSSDGNAPWKGYLWSTVIDENYHLVQGFGSSSSPMVHSPILLYQNNGDQHNISASEAYPLFKQISTLSDEGLTYKDSGCFGVFPVDVNGETLLVLPYQRNSEKIAFKVAHWTDKTNLSSLTELWQLPNNETTYPCEDTYQTFRPKVVCISESSLSSEDSEETEILSSDDDATIVVAYMPGSFMGAYKVSIIEDQPVSRVTDPSISKFNSYKLDGRLLTITPKDKTETIELYSVDGQILLGYANFAIDKETISLDHLSPGIYLLKIGNYCHKILLK